MVPWSFNVFCYSVFKVCSKAHAAVGGAVAIVRVRLEAHADLCLGKIPLAGMLEVLSDFGKITT